MRRTLTTRRVHAARMACIAACFLLAGSAFAQTGTIQGVVLGPDELPVPGANVALEGTAAGASTDVEGRFSFVAPIGTYTLAVTFIGYDTYTAPVTVEAGETLELEIELTEGAVDLDEIVVTALGIEREERSISYAYQEVDDDVVRRANESNLVNALAGKVAGLQVTSSSGQPGKAARITIRGNASFLGDNQPLFVIDGVPISNDEDDNPENSSLFTGGTSNRALDIDPNIIEDITVLKGASATALYGSRAANGAIIITTKGGRAGLDAVSTITFNSVVRFDDAIIDGYQTRFTQGAQGCFSNGLPLAAGGVVQDCYPFGNPQTSSSWGPSIDDVNANAELLQALGVDRVEAFDPREDFYRTGAVYENSLSATGSAVGGNYFLSGSYLDQEGVVPGSALDRYSLLAKFGTDLTPRLNVEASANYVRTENSWLTEGNTNDSFLWSVNQAPISFDITQPTFTDGPAEGQQRTWSAARNNPFWIADNNQYTSDVDRLIGGFTAAYEVAPWLRVRNRAGIDSYADTRAGQTEIGTVGLYQRGALWDQAITRREINNDLTAQASQRWARFGADLLVGHNVNRQYYEYSYLRGEVLEIPSFFDIQNAGQVTGNQYKEERLLYGLYGQATMDYDDWAYLTLTGRNDWSSTLPEDNNSYFYPSVSLGLVFTEPLGFLQRSPLSYGKVRAAWARVGNDADPYSTATPFVQANPGDGQRGNIDFPFGGVNAFQLTNVLGDPNLRPEITTEYEVGVDLRFWGERARLDAAYYDRRTRDQIFNVPVSGATGFVRYLTNAGELRNSGYEVVLGLTPIQTRSVTWDVTANWSKNTAEVVELAEGVENIYLYGFTWPQIRIQEGEDGYGVIWSNRYARADPEEHADLFAENPELEEGMLLIGEDGLPITAGTLGVVGNVQPDWLANVRTGFTYKGLTVSGLVDIRRGGDVLNFDLFYTTFRGTAAITEDRGATQTFEGFNVATGEMNDVEITRDETFYQRHYSSVFENFVEDGSYVKLREVSVAYTLPARMASPLGVRSATLTATGRNLWIDSDFSYGDPEGNIGGAVNGQGFYHMVTPTTRSFSLGVRLGL